MQGNCIWTLVILSLALTSAGCQDTSEPEKSEAPSAEPKPGLKVFDITAYGAKADGQTDNTPAVSKAIAAAVEVGGGQILIPPAEKPYLITDSIELFANNLHLIGPGATLLLKDGAGKGRTDPKNLLHIVLIKGTEEVPVEDVSVEGLTIDANYWGQGGTSSTSQSVKIAGIPRGIKVEHASKVLIDKVTITRPFVGMTFGLGSHECEARDTVVTKFHHDAFGVTPERINRGASKITFLRCEAKDSMDGKVGGLPGTRVKGWEIEEGAQDIKLIDCSVVNTSSNGFFVRPHWTRAKMFYTTGNVELIRCRVEKAGKGGFLEAFFVNAHNDRQPVKDVQLVDCYADNGNVAVVYGPENVEIKGGHFGQMTIGFFKDVDDPHHDPGSYWKFKYHKLPPKSVTIENVTVKNGVRINAVPGYDGVVDYLPDISLRNVTIKGDLEIIGSKALVKMEDCKVEGKTSHRLQTPAIVVNRCTEPPTIDGAGGDKAWRESSLASDITHNPVEEGYRRGQSFVRLCYDDIALYALIECLEPHMEKLHVAGTHRDADMWQDDCVEIFLHRGDDASDNFNQWMINAMGVIYDGNNKGEAWDSSARVAAQQLSDRYVLEVAIPWKDLGDPPKKGDRWQANFARGQATDGTRWIWSWQYGGPFLFGDIQKMGILIFE